jgi:hypothetical protein
MGRLVVAGQMLLHIAVRDIGQLTDLGMWGSRDLGILGTTAMARFVAASASITCPQNYFPCKVILAAT